MRSPGLFMLIVVVAGGCVLSHGPTDGNGASGSAVVMARPVDLAGLANVMLVANGVYSGGMPEGDAGFDALASLGVRTIVSVDAARPDVGRAEALGMRYVHVPIEYSGVNADDAVSLALAVRDLPSPIYVHCHHGKHRAPTAAALALVELGRLTPEQGIERMRSAGTSERYPGLYACVEGAGLLSEAAAAGDGTLLPRVAEPGTFSEAMAAINRVNDELVLIAEAGWKTPADHPDLVPAAEAGELTELFRRLASSEAMEGEPADLVERMNAAVNAATEIEAAIGSGDAAAADEGFARLANSCRSCHRRYRDY